MQSSEMQNVLCMVCLLIAPLAPAGLALINTGLGRSRNAAHSMMTAICVIAVAACSYFVLGRCWQGSSGEASWAISMGGRSWDWIGAARPFFARLPADGSPAFLKAWMGLTGVSLAGVIPLGSGAERWRLSSACASTALLAGFTFPVFAHWAWGGGWLAQLGFVDVGGSGVIQALGGFTALAIIWILGPRRGKYGNDGMPMAIPGHSAVLVLFGCLLATAGWIGLNAAGAILFADAATGRMILIAVNTMLCAACAALVAAVITRIRFGRPDASLTANGWIGGLVATSAGCAFLPPAAAALMGLIAGGLVTFSVELLELRLDVDDPGGSVSVHAVAGIWGLLATGMLGRFPGGEGRLLAQILGIATLIGFVFPLTWGLNWLLNRVMPMRVSREGERQGMDLFELGAGAYPDFVTHTDEFMQR
jgi:Amt family ammonium transporter